MHGRRSSAYSLYKMRKRRPYKIPGHRSGTLKSSDGFGPCKMPEQKCGARKMHEHRSGPSKMPSHRTGPYKMPEHRPGPYKMPSHLPSHRGSCKASVGAIRS